MAFEEIGCDTGSDPELMPLGPFPIVCALHTCHSGWDYISSVDNLRRHILNDENRRRPDLSEYFNRASTTIGMTEMKTPLQFDEKGDDFEYHEWRSHESNYFDFILGHIPERTICQEARQARVATKLWHTGQDKLLAEPRSSRFSIKAGPSIPCLNSKDDNMANFDDSTDMARHGDWSFPSTRSPMPLSLQFIIVISLYNLWLYAMLSNGLSHWSNLEINGVSPWSCSRSPATWLGLVISLVGILTPLLVIFMEAMLLVRWVRLEWSQMWRMDCCDEDRKDMNRIDWLYGRRSRGYILLNSLTSLHLLMRTRHIRTAKELQARDCFRYASLRRKMKSALWTRISEALRVTFGARSSHKAVHRTSSGLPHFTILCPTYDEDLKIPIISTLVSLRAAIAAYEETCRTPSPFLNDDFNFLVTKHSMKISRCSGQACVEENPTEEPLLISKDKVELDDQAHQQRPSKSSILRSSSSPSHRFKAWFSRTVARAFVSSTSATTLNRISIMI